ncbi:MAG: hypothetical protein LBT46_13410 [Planctomycetaceae bacterium]|jgi:hypothetical protein|nr:hypothetical protein [Planctomycetaceae bacterium]
MYRFFLLVFLLLCSTAGCRNRSEAVNHTLGESGNLELGGTQHQKEDFDRSFAILDSLEDAPCLPNMPGYEKIVNTADRLDKWIRSRKADADWKADSELVEIEKCARNVSEAAQQTVDSLKALQDGSGNSASTADKGLAGERERLAAALQTFLTGLQTFGKQAELPSVEMYAQQVAALQKKIVALEKIPNLTDDAVRSFAKQLQKEAEDFGSIANTLENYADQLKIDGLSLQSADAEYLKQATWMRNISHWARGEKQTLLDRTTNLFDWTVCNVELRNGIVPINGQQAVDMPQQFPWQSILLGYSTVLDRAAVFIELLRQQRIDAALLAVPNPDAPHSPLFWAVGVLLDGEVSIYLLAHGFPLPNAAGAQIAADGALTFPEPATLSQCLNDDSLLRRLDTSNEKRFPMTAELLKNSTAYLFITPESASLRMKMLENELSGTQTMVLYADTAELRRRFSEAKGITAVQLWKYPFRTAFDQIFRHSVTEEFLSLYGVPSLRNGTYPLWTGRILYFKGQIAGQSSAMTYWQDARVPDREMIEYSNHPQFARQPNIRTQMQIISAQASYFLALASFENDSIPAAEDFLEVLRSGTVDLWRDNAEYMLGRIAEREKKYADAVKHYGRTASSLSGPGNTIRAKWLPATDSHTITNTNP